MRHALTRCGAHKCPSPASATTSTSLIWPKRTSRAADGRIGEVTAIRAVHPAGELSAPGAVRCAGADPGCKPHATGHVVDVVEHDAAQMRQQPGYKITWPVIIEPRSLHDRVTRRAAITQSAPEPATVVLHAAFSPEAALTDIAAHRATIFGGVPTMWTLMLGHPSFAEHDLSNLRGAVIGGSNADPAPVRGDRCRPQRRATDEPLRLVRELRSVRDVPAR